MINLRSEVSAALNNITGVAKVSPGWPKDFKTLPCVCYEQVDNVPTVQSTDGEVASQIQYTVHIFANTLTDAESIAEQVDTNLTEIGLYRQGMNQQAEDLAHLIMRYSVEIDVVTLEKYKI